MSWAVLIVLLIALSGCSDSERSVELPTPASRPKPAPLPVVDELGAALLQELATLHRKRQYQRGLARVEAELERDPNQPRLYYNLGVFRGSLGNHQGAAEAFLRELERSPGHADSHRALAAAYTRQNLLEESLPHFEACLDALPDDTACAFQLGSNLSALGLHQDAEPYLERAAELLQDAASYAELGMLLRRRGKLEQAAEAFSKALTADPRHLTTLVNYGQTLLALGRTEDGEDMLERHRELAELNDRLETLERAIEVTGQSAAALLDVAGLHLERDDLAAAIAAFEQALALDPGNPIPALELASLYLKDGRLTEAAHCIDLAVAADPQNPGPLFYLGLLRLRIGDRQAAETALAGSLELGAWPPSAYLDLGSTYDSTGDFNQAETAYLSALSIDPQSSEGHFRLASNRRQQGDRDGATEAARRAVDLDPEHDGAWALLAASRLETGDRAGAETAFRRVMAIQRFVLLSDDGAEQLLREIPETDGDARSFFRQLLQAVDADP